LAKNSLITVDDKKWGRLSFNSVADKEANELTITKDIMSWLSPEIAKLPNWVWDSSLVQWPAALSTAQDCFSIPPRLSREPLQNFSVPNMLRKKSFRIFTL